MIKLFGCRASFTAAREASCLGGNHVALVVAGSGIFGVGLTLTGSTPAHAFGELGLSQFEGGFGTMSVAVYTVIGGLLGALVWGYTEHSITGAIYDSKVLVDVNTLDKTLGQPYLLVSACVASACVVAVAALETAYPWRSAEQAELALMGPKTYEESTYSFLSDVQWVPAACGAMAGCMTFPAVLMMSQVLESTGGYSTVRERSVVVIYCLAFFVSHLTGGSSLLFCFF